MSTLEQEIEALTSLDRPALVARWRALFRSDPPSGISISLLIRTIAYDMQARRYGGLRPATTRRLQKIVATTSNGGHASRAAAPSLQARARLVREWNGATHVVEVVVDGFLWDGKRHTSLSAIARAITGARWSGPRFFGLIGQRAP